MPDLTRLLKSQKDDPNKFSAMGKQFTPYHYFMASPVNTASKSIDPVLASGYSVWSE